MELKIDGVNRTLGTADLAKFIKGIILDKPNKSALYQSLASNLGTKDYKSFVEGLQKQKKNVNLKRRDELKKELEQLNKEIESEPQTKTKKK
jgi:hypothetical protein